MVLNINTPTKLRESIPLSGAFFGKIDSGPTKKNLVIPKELVSKLVVNVTNGADCRILDMSDVVLPTASVG